MSLLHLAVGTKEVDIIAALCKKDIDLNMINHLGNTPLHDAVNSTFLEGKYFCF